MILKYPQPSLKILIYNIRFVIFPFLIQNEMLMKSLPLQVFLYEWRNTTFQCPKDKNYWIWQNHRKIFFVFLMISIFLQNGLSIRLDEIQLQIQTSQLEIFPVESEFGVVVNQCIYMWPLMMSQDSKSSLKASNEYYYLEIRTQHDLPCQ